MVNMEVSFFREEILKGDNIRIVNIGLGFMTFSHLQLSTDKVLSYHL